MNRNLLNAVIEITVAGTTLLIAYAQERNIPVMALIYRAIMLFASKTAAFLGNIALNAEILYYAEVKA